MNTQGIDSSAIEFAAIPLDPDYPVSGVDFNIRGEVPNINPHIHDCFEIGFCHSGTGIFLVEEKTFSFRAGDAVVIPENDCHIMMGAAESGCSWSFLNLNPEALLYHHIREKTNILNTTRYSGAGFQNLIPGTEAPGITRVIEEILAIRRGNDPDDKQEIRALVWMLMLRLYRKFSGTENSENSERSEIVRIMPAMKYILKNLNQDIPIPVLAKACNCSEANFRRIFHRIHNCSPNRYVLNLRMKGALLMLENETLSIYEVALKSGFQTLSNFNRQFHASFGLSPSEFRKQKRK